MFPSSLRHLAWLGTGLVLVALGLLASLALGSRPIAPDAVWDVLVGGGSQVESHVVRDLRVPRTVLGVVVGVALGLAGVLMQGVTRNPIAEPGILGVSQGAALGVAVAIGFLGVHRIEDYLWFAFAGAAVAAVVVYGVAGAARGGATPLRLALAGAALNALLASVISLIVTTRGQALEGFRFWQVGNLSGRELDIPLTLVPFLLVGAVLTLVSIQGMDALALGDDVARGLGRNVGLTRAVAAVAAILLTAVAVAGAGPIAFVGLAVPHMARRLVGSGHAWLIPLAALLGAALVLVADVVGRVLFPPSEVPVAVMCAVIGVPFLVVLVRRRGVIV